MVYRWMPAELYQRMEHMRRTEMERDAAKWRLVNGGSQGRSWLGRSGCWLLCQLGRRLIILGRALQHAGQGRGDIVRT